MRKHLGLLLICMWASTRLPASAAPSDLSQQTELACIAFANFALEVATAAELQGPQAPAVYKAMRQRYFEQARVKYLEAQKIAPETLQSAQQMAHEREKALLMKFIADADRTSNDQDAKQESLKKYFLQRQSTLACR